MKFNFGPWRRINDLEKVISDLRDQIEFTKSAHADVSKRLKEIEEKHTQSVVTADEAKNNLRRMAMIMAMRGLDKIVIILVLFIVNNLIAQPILRNNYTTNQNPIVSVYDTNVLASLTNTTISQAGVLFAGNFAQTGVGSETSPYVSSDGTAGISNALLTLPRGGSVSLGQYRFNVTNAIFIPSPSITLEGTSPGFNIDPNGTAQGINGAKLFFGNTGSGACVIISNNVNKIGGITLERLYFWGMSKTAGARGVEWDTQADQTKVRNCNFGGLNFGAYGISGMDACFITDSSFLGNGYGIVLTNGTVLHGYNKIFNSEISDNDAYGIWLADPTTANMNFGTRIVACTLVRNSGNVQQVTGANIYSGFNSTIISGCYIGDAGHSIANSAFLGSSGVIIHGTNSLVEGNQFIANSVGAAIKLSGSGHSVVGNIFSSNLADIVVESGSPTIVGNGSPTIITNTGPGNLTGLVGWYRAYGLNNIPDGGSVVNFFDSSTNENDVMSPVIGTRPLFKSSRVNGYPSVFFSSGNNSFNNKSLPFASSDFAWFLVAKLGQSTNTVQQNYIMGNLQNSGQFNGFGFSVNADGTLSAVCRVSGSNKTLSTPHVATNIWARWTFARVAGTGTLYSNDVVMASGDMSGDVTGSAFTVGAERSQTAGTVASGEIAELVLDSATADTNLVNSFFKTQYGF